MSSIAPLVDLIVQNARALEDACAASGAKLPDLDAHFDPASEAFRKDPVAAEAANVIAAAALQLVATVLSPPLTLLTAATGYVKSAALRVALEAGVTEILREAGPQGLHVDDMAKINGLDPQKLSRFLRFLATNHIFREVAPDVFANNRISTLLDTMKPSKEIIADPEHKYDGTKGIAAACATIMDEQYKAGGYAWETLSDPVDGASGEPDGTAMGRAFGLRQSTWDIFARPENSFRSRRFNIGMSAAASLQPADVIMTAFDWKSLPAGSLVVDVGGGIGAATRSLAKNCPDLKVVLQDLPGVIEDAKKWWDENAQDAVRTGQVTLEAHSFFDPQPSRNVGVFLLKQVLHDWSNLYSARILRHLRTAASETTKLVIMDDLLSFACREPSDESLSAIPGAVPSEAPEPLLANYGAAHEFGYTTDLMMYFGFNAQERNVRQFQNLLRSTGWKLTTVRRPSHGIMTNAIEAVPL
ncbi:O-methyltransferase-domain-containing protein [Schizophyllum amplum]|uniref:O-methyltransferase-domain-containing protein n=1 Tax=Schizophyllum amplum TaxID=97359 RepID=A0A550CFL4_9AGAR|nr:O-methyltransferase-domain-containing protein [Auriculariopsis ampla]